MLSSHLNKLYALYYDLSFLEVFYILLSYSFLLPKVLDCFIIVISDEFFVFSSLLGIYPRVNCKDNLPMNSLERTGDPRNDLP